MRYRHQIWMALGRSRLFFDTFKLIQLRNKGINLVNRDSDIVIEGYPRSANTFAYVAFEMMQEPNFKKGSIAHHIHGPMQFIRGLKENKPCLLLIRPPVDAVVSLLIREQNLSPNSAFKNYIKFHEPLLPYINSLVISDFKTTVNSFTDVVNSVNEKFNTNFNIMPITDSFMRECKLKIREMDKRDSGSDDINSKKVGFPSKEKILLKKKIKDKVLSEANGQLLVKSKNIYQEFKNNRLS